MTFRPQAANWRASDRGRNPDRGAGAPALVLIKCPGGVIDVTVVYENDADGFTVKSAGLRRAARWSARGDVSVPGTIWGGE
jgi:4-oxalomesaconate tautomerase